MENELSAHFNDAKEWQMYRRMSKAAKNSHMFMYITFIHLEVRVPTLISFCRVFHALHPKFIVKIYSGLLSVPLYDSTTCNAGTRSEWTCMWKSDFSITYIIKLREFVLAQKIDRPTLWMLQFHTENYLHIFQVTICFVCFAAFLLQNDLNTLPDFIAVACHDSDTSQGFCKHLYGSTNFLLLLAYH